MKNEDANQVKEKNLQIEDEKLAKHNGVEEDSVSQWEWIIKPGDSKGIFFIDESLAAVEYENRELVILDLITNSKYDLGWETISHFSEGYAKVSLDSKVAYVNKKGVPIFEEMFDGGLEFNESVVGVQYGGKWGYINKEGKVIIDFDFEEVTSFNDGIAMVKKHGLWGGITKSGEMLTEVVYQDKRTTSEGYTAVKKNDKWGFIDNKGQEICNFEYDQVSDFHEGLAAVSLNGKWGYLDVKGSLSIGLIYDGASDFSEGLAAVMLRNQLSKRTEWAYIDKNDNTIIDFYPYNASGSRRVYVGGFEDGKAFVTKDLYTIIDANGEEVYNQDSLFFIHGFTYYSDINAIRGYVFTDEKMLVRKYGLVGLNGQTILEPVFDNIREIKANYIIVENKIDNEVKIGLVKLNVD
jgi:hypothetical protein